MKPKSESHSAVQELCQKLKIQLEELAVVLADEAPLEEISRRSELMEQLKEQLNELSR